MVKVVGVGFRPAGKVYYFDPCDFELSNGDPVIVETGNGIEYGVVRGSAKDVSEKEFGKTLKKNIQKGIG